MNARVTRLKIGALATVLLVLVGLGASGGAWALWTLSSASGGSGAAKATTVATGATPSVTADGSSMIVTWTAATLGNGVAVSGYRVTRYSASLVPQTTLTNCSGTITNLGCIENAVPAGTWYYTVTPLFGGWTGAESPMSAAAVSNGVAPINTVWMWVTP
jgi:hypothetical protein